MKIGGARVLLGVSGCAVPRGFVGGASFWAGVAVLWRFVGGASFWCRCAVGVGGWHVLLVERRRVVSRRVMT